MTLSITISRKMLAATSLVVLLTILLAGGTKWVFAQDDFAIYVFDVCIKGDGSIRVVEDISECKRKELVSSLVSGAGFQALEARISDLETANANLQTRLEELEPFVRLLHRNSAAVIDIDNAGGSSVIATSLKYRLAVCTPDEYETVPCPDLEWTLTEADEGSTITLTANDDPDFTTIAERLTNGDNDVVIRERRLVSGGIGGTEGPERSYFRDFAGPDSVDLAGFNLSSISLSVDYISLRTPGDDPNNDGIWTDYRLIGRLFFGLDD